jgi:hypothetical protein
MAVTQQQPSQQKQATAVSKLFKPFHESAEANHVGSPPTKPEETAKGPVSASSSEGEEEGDDKDAAEVEGLVDDAQLIPQTAPHTPEKKPSG